METEEFLYYLLKNGLHTGDFEKTFNEAFFTPAEVAVKCGTSESVVYAWIAANMVKSVELKGQTYIFVTQISELRDVIVGRA